MFLKCLKCPLDVGCTSLAASETYGHGEHYKQTVQGPSNDTHHTPAVSRTAQSIIHPQTL